LIDGGGVRVDGAATKAAHRLRAGERIAADIPPPPAEEMVAEAVALRVVFEDEHLLVVDKPAGMVTHPGAGQPTGTLAAAALAHAPGIAGVGGPRRPGIVHRLDKGTSGLIVLAKTQLAYDALTAQLADRTMTRRYVSIVHGHPHPPEGVVDRPIGRDPRSRVRMAIAPPGRGKRALTRYRVLERFADLSVVECRLETGRTHQIRVHLAALGHPVLGDRTYGPRATPRDADRELDWLVAELDGVALHAERLELTHPASGERRAFSCPLPYRIGRIVSHLRSGAR
jgi:23S rRNA pseudouridine1911/1915/1917 synthase